MRTTRGARGAWTAILYFASVCFVCGVLGLAALKNTPVAEHTLTLKDGAVLGDADVMDLLYGLLLVGFAYLAPGVLVLVGIRAAGVLLLLGFAWPLGEHIYSLVTIGRDALLHGGGASILAGALCCQALLRPKSRAWILRC